MRNNHLNNPIQIKFTYNIITNSKSLLLIKVMMNKERTQH